MSRVRREGEGLETQTRDASEIRFPEFLGIDVVVDVNGVSADVASQLLDELSPHAIPPEPRCEPMPYGMRAQAPSGIPARRIVEAGRACPRRNDLVDALSPQPVSVLADEESGTPGR